MNTFLPYPDFEQSAKVMDKKRLLKQVVEADQLIRSITLPDYGWKSHPASKMWKDNVDALKKYFNVFLVEAKARGIKFKYELMEVPDNVSMPSWLGDEELHSKQRASLLSKNEEWYSQFNWKEKPEYGYKWPK